ncbi:MAG: RraA family protein [Pseudorhodobacter sp.]
MPQTPMTRETYRTMGRIELDRISQFELPRTDPSLLKKLRAMEGISELVSDALDDLGIDGVIDSRGLRPTIMGRCVVGPALTLRNEPLGLDPFEAATGGHRNRQADFEAHNLTRPGDILVIKGAKGVSNIGGISATMAKRQGSIATIVDGGIRDVATSRAIGHPIWCSDITARTGRWRQETAEINGPVTICGIVVCPGDIICADDSAVCVVPLAALEEVVARVIRRAETDEEYISFLQSGQPLHDLPRPDPEQYRE